MFWTPARVSQRRLLGAGDDGAAVVAEDLVPQLEEAANEASKEHRPTGRAATLKADVIKVLRDALEELED